MNAATCLTCGRVIEYTEIVDDNYMLHGRAVGAIAWNDNLGESNFGKGPIAEPLCQECVDQFVTAEFSFS